MDLTCRVCQANQPGEDEEDDERGTLSKLASRGRCPRTHVWLCPECAEVIIALPGMPGGVAAMDACGV